MKKTYLLLLLLIFFILGVAVSSPIKDALQMFQSVKNKDCITAKICVGDEANVIFGLFAMDGIDGLTMVFC